MNGFLCNDCIHQERCAKFHNLVSDSKIIFGDGCTDFFNKEYYEAVFLLNEYIKTGYTPSQIEELKRLMLEDYAATKAANAILLEERKKL